MQTRVPGDDHRRDSAMAVPWNGAGFRPRIDAYIAKAAPFAQPILKHLRAEVHAASSGALPRSAICHRRAP